MWRPKRAGGVETTTEARRCVNESYLDSLAIGEFGEDAGETSSQHGLAPAGWAMQQEMMPTGRGDLDRPTGQCLPFDVGHVGNVVGRLD